MPTPADLLFCYCLQVGGREFAIRVDHGGNMIWDDYPSRRAAQAVDGDGLAAPLFAAEPDAFTVEVQARGDLLGQIRVAAARVTSDEWAAEDEARLDDLLLPLFWTQVNLRLRQPIEHGNTND
jgi:hypothetical protein